MVFGILSSMINEIRHETQNQSPLKIQLCKATDSGVIDVPKDLFEGIMEASSKNAESRRVVMMHLFECFTQLSKAKAWLRVHAALMLTEDLVLNFPVLSAEIASGFYFDLLQQLSFLEHFELATDRRAQALVRSKAQSVRRMVAPKLADAELPGHPDCMQNKDNKDLSEDTASTCSVGETDNAQDCKSDDDEQVSVTDPDLLTRLLKEVQGDWVTKKGSTLKINGLVATWSSGFTGSLSADHEFLYLKFPQDEKEYHAYLRKEDSVLCWSDGDCWRREENRDVPLKEQEWHGVLLPQASSIKLQKKAAIHGVVSIGHCSDTESESSSDETPAVGHKQRGQRKMRTRRERTEKSTLTSQSQDGQEAVLDLLA